MVFISLTDKYGYRIFNKSLHAIMLKAIMIQYIQILN